MSGLREEPLTKIIIEAFYAVYDALGFGFLESVYVNALCVELGRRGVPVAREVPIKVVYLGVEVGTFRGDVLVADRVLLEIKATRTIADADERQLLNYLRSSEVEIGMLLHFGPRPKFYRRLYTNDRKHPVQNAPPV